MTRSARDDRQRIERPSMRLGYFHNKSFVYNQLFSPQLLVLNDTSSLYCCSLELRLREPVCGANICFVMVVPQIKVRNIPYNSEM